MYHSPSSTRSSSFVLSLSLSILCSSCASSFSHFLSFRSRSLSTPLFCSPFFSFSSGGRERPDALMLCVCRVLVFVCVCVCVCACVRACVRACCMCVCVMHVCVRAQERPDALMLQEHVFVTQHKTFACTEWLSSLP